MSDPAFYNAHEAAIWAQPNGANTEPLYLGCHELLSIEQSLGDFEPRFCPDPAKVGKFLVKRKVRGAPDLPTAEISVPIGKMLDYLEKWNCAGNIFVNKVACGARDLFTNYDRTFILRLAEKTGTNYAGIAARDPETSDDTMVTVPMTFEELLIAVKQECHPQAVAAVKNLLVAAFLMDDNCGGALCGGTPVVKGQYGVAAGAGAVAAKAELYFTDDSGDTWTASAADPFAVAEDIAVAAMFRYGVGITRTLVGRSTTAAAAPAEVAYSDDFGATWTAVNVGSTNGQFITSLFAYDRSAIYAGTNTGYIYKSTDGGATWTVQDAGVISNTDWLAVHFATPYLGVFVGEANDAAITYNGGMEWTALTLDASKAAVNLAGVHVLDQYHIWVIYADGEIWFTNNGGTTWTLRTDIGTVGVDIGFVNELLGYALTTTNLYRTRDGGYTWETVCTAFSDPLTDLAVIDTNEVFMVGEVSGAVAQVIHVTE